MNFLILLIKLASFNKHDQLACTVRRRFEVNNIWITYYYGRINASCMVIKTY